MGVSGLGLEGLTSDSAGGGGGVPDSPLILQAFGVVGAPELAFLNDEDTGLYRPAPNELGLVAGGVELFRISALGNAQLCAGTDPAADGGDLDLKSGDSGVAATGNGGDVNILAGSSVATTGDGGIVSIKSGDGFFQGAGGDILVEVGEGGAAGPGASGNLFINTLTGVDAAAGLQVPIPGLVSIYGIGRSGSGPAGNLELWGGYASGAGAGSIGGDLILWGGGQGGGAGEGGNAMLIGGESDTTPGDAKVIGGQATSVGPGGQATVTGGAGFGGFGEGGTAGLIGGAGAGTGGGASVFVRGGAGGTGSPADGGGVQIIGGQALATDRNGGAVTIEGGTGNGAGADGDILLRIAGVTEFRIDAATGIHAETGSGPAMLNEGPSSTNPVFVPNQADPDTGLTRSGVDQLSLVCGGLEAIRVIDPADASAGNTNFFLFDDDNGQLEIVSVGSADSGGAGFKVLRIAN